MEGALQWTNSFLLCAVWRYAQENHSACRVAWCSLHLTSSCKYPFEIWVHLWAQLIYLCVYQRLVLLPLDLPTELLYLVMINALILLSPPCYILPNVRSHCWMPCTTHVIYTCQCTYVEVGCISESFCGNIGTALVGGGGVILIRDLDLNFFLERALAIFHCQDCRLSTWFWLCPGSAYLCSLQLSNAGGVAELIICYCGFNVFHWEDVSTGSAGGSATCRIWMFIVGCLD
jgi:hypothetical protein